MKKTLIKGLLPTALALALCGCSAEDAPMANGKGSIALEVQLDTELVNSSGSSRAAGDISAEDLTLTLTADDGSYSESWEGVSAFPTDQQFAVGDYTLTAEYGKIEEEGFEKPCYSGSTHFTVSENHTTSVSLTAALANVMFSIAYTDEFKAYMTKWSAELHAAGGRYVTYTQNETRPAHIRPGNTTVSVNVTKPNGKTANIQAAQLITEPKHHYHLTIDIKDGGASDASMVIGFDDNVDQEDVVISLSDEVMDAPAPTLTPIGFTPGTALDIITGMHPADLQAKVDIMARGGLASVKLTTNCNSLIDNNWPQEIDLINTPDNVKQYMQDLGFKCFGLWKNPDKMAVVDFTDVLDYIDDETGTFTLVAEDRYGKVTEPLELVVNIRQHTLSITQARDLYTTSTELSLTLDYDGYDPENNVKIQSLNNRGTWTDLPMISCTPSEQNENQYTVAVEVPTGDKSLTVRPYCRHNTNLAGITIERKNPPFALSCNANNVFAKRASLSVSGDNETPDQLAEKGIVYISSDGGITYTEPTQTHTGGTFRLTNLAPGTKYMARIRIGRINSNAIEFTTETAAQIPNGNLDAEVTNNGSASHWENVVFQGWGTNNPMTTSQGSNYAYVRISGTKQTDEAHNGKAARIATQGWGSGNSATGSQATSGACKYIDAGLLHLGASRTVRPDGYSDISGPLNTDDLNCGIEFNSRPTSVSFWFKYEPKSDQDRGEALARIYDEDGVILAQGTLELAKTGTYTQKTITFSYPAGAKKAAKIYIRFMSTNKSTALTRTNGWLTGPGFGNLSRGEFAGSALYIDDITLNY